MICPNCGQENSEDSKFCENCGSKLTKGSLVPKSTTQPEKEGWSTTSKILVIAIVILIVILGAAIGILLKSNNNPTITPSNNTGTPTTITASTGIPLSEVPNLAQSITQSGIGFSTMNFGGVTLDKNQCLYITARAIVMLNKGETGSIPINQYGNPDNPYGTVTSANIVKSDYVSMAQRTYTWMDNNGAAPNYLGITNPGQPDLSTYDVLKLYSKVLTAYKNTGQLPTSIQIP
jgi:hypothetical protein